MLALFEGGVAATVGVIGVAVAKEGTFVAILRDEGLKPAGERVDVGLGVAIFLVGFAAGGGWDVGFFEV